MVPQPRPLALVPMVSLVHVTPEANARDEGISREAIERSATKLTSRRVVDIFVVGLMFEPFVVIMDRDREHLLGVVLADDVIVKNRANLFRGRDAVARFHQRELGVLADDVRAQIDAFIANEDRRPSDEFAHLVLALAAERAVERVL